MRVIWYRTLSAICGNLTEREYFYNAKSIHKLLKIGDSKTVFPMYLVSPIGLPAY